MKILRFPINIGTRINALNLDIYSGVWFSVLVDSKFMAELIPSLNHESLFNKNAWGINMGIQYPIFGKLNLKLDYYFSKSNIYSTKYSPFEDTILGYELEFPKSLATNALSLGISFIL